MYIPQNIKRVRGLGDEQSDLQTSLDAVNAQIQKDNDEAARLRAAINKVSASKVLAAPSSTSMNINATTSGFLTTDIQSNTKIFGMDWYIPAIGVGALLMLLRR